MRWLFGLVTAAAATRATAQRPLNLDFAMPSVANDSFPWGWSLGWSAFAPGGTARFVREANGGRLNGPALVVTVADSTATTTRSVMLQLSADFAKGRDLELVGWARSADPGAAAVLQLEEWLDRQVGATDSAVVTRGQAWRPIRLRVRVPSNSTAHSVVVLAGARGRGTVRFSELRLRVDGRDLRAMPNPLGSIGPEAMRDLRRRATPLVSVAPDATTTDRADLEQLSRIVGDARLVGLGESTHGTREFFQLKHRFLEHLVTRLGFRGFAIEANQLAVEQLNRYVQGGPGTAREAMRSLFRVWNTEEVLAMVEWARRYNAAHAVDPVRFVGYDMQDHRTPIDTLEAAVRRWDPAVAPELIRLTSGYRREPSWATPQVADTTRARWHAEADTVWQLVSARRTRWLDAGRNPADSAAAEWAVQSANLYRQAARLNASLNSPDRDSLMAANLDWAIGALFGTKRVVVWAHDVHVSHGGDRRRSFNGGAQMGAHLKHTFGHRYRAISLLTYEGEYSATRSFTDHRMFAARGYPAPTGSLEAALHQVAQRVGAPALLVDVRSDSADAGAAWLWTPRPIRHIGFAAYDYGFEMRAIVPLEFDGVAFVDRSTASRLLR